MRVQMPPLVPAVPVDGFALRASANPPSSGGAFLRSGSSESQIIPTMPPYGLPSDLFQKQLPSLHLVSFFEIDWLIVRVFVSDVCTLYEQLQGVFLVRVFADVEIDFVFGISPIARKDLAQLQGQEVFLTGEKAPAILECSQDLRKQKRQRMAVLFELPFDTPVIDHQAMKSHQVKIDVRVLLGASADTVGAIFDVDREHDAGLPICSGNVDQE